MWTIARCLVVGALLFACTPTRKAAYQRLADEINPIYLSLIPKVAVIQRLGPDAYGNDPGLEAACAAADVELRLLRVLRTENNETYPAHTDWRLSYKAGALLDHRPSACIDDRNGAIRIRTTCRWFCLDRWSNFTKHAAALQERAMEEGVHILPIPRVLPPGPGPGRYLP